MRAWAVVVYTMIGLGGFWSARDRHPEMPPWTQAGTVMLCVFLWPLAAGAAIDQVLADHPPRNS